MRARAVDPICDRDADCRSGTGGFWGADCETAEREAGFGCLRALHRLIDAAFDRS